MNIKRIRQRLSRLVSGEPSTQDKLKSILSKVVEESQKTSKSKLNKDEVLATAKLAEMVMPAVLKGDNIDADACRDWAFACGKVMGLLAGMALDPDKQRRAILQIAETAIATAGQLNKKIDGLGIGEPRSVATPKEPNASAPNTTSGSLTPASTTGGSKLTKQDKALLEQKRKMAEDLESQAMLEKDDAAKAALKLMAERLRKEISLEETPSSSIVH